MRDLAVFDGPLDIRTGRGPDRVIFDVADVNDEETGETVLAEQPRSALRLMPGQEGEVERVAWRELP